MASELPVNDIHLLSKNLLKPSSYRSSGGIGIRAGLRSLWRDPYEFKSRLEHHLMPS